MNPKDEYQRKKDTTISTKLRAELPGILRWAVEGCREWQEHGLNEPKAVIEAVDEYRRDMNSIGHFFRSVATSRNPPKSDVKTQRSSTLYDAYLKWSGEHLFRLTAPQHASRRWDTRTNLIVMGENIGSESDL